MPPILIFSGIFIEFTSFCGFPIDPRRSFAVFLRQRKNRYKGFAVEDINVVAVDTDVVCRLVLPVQRRYVPVQAAAGVAVPDAVPQRIFSVLVGELLRQAETFLRSSRCVVGNAGHFRRRATKTAIMPINATTATLIQSGDSTHHHDQAITCVSLSVINTMVSRPTKPIPPPPLFFLSMYFIPPHKCGSGCECLSVCSRGFYRCPPRTGPMRRRIYGGSGNDLWRHSSGHIQCCGLQAAGSHTRCGRDSLLPAPCDSAGRAP
ncbi:hypothetical protein 2203_scaffold802_00024 [Bacteriophage sp.]|nr:hypothetical protein 2203_scaffold802_00024 [Bacteriophage sp.]